jgi:hypothetical protein
MPPLKIAIEMTLMPTPIANEHAHRGFTHDLIRSPEGQVELINLAKQTAPDLIVTTSGMGSGRKDERIAEIADFIIIHFNNTDIADVPDRINALKHLNKPIVCNEDTKIRARGAEIASLCAGAYEWMKSRVDEPSPATQSLLRASIRRFVDSSIRRFADS